MLLGHTINCLDNGFVRYIDHMGSDKRIVEAARISYRSPSKGDEADKKLLNYLYFHRHTSPFEMCQITLNIKMPMFVAREYVRHRMQSMNEVSARYTALPNEFYFPDEWRGQDAKNKQGSVENKNLDQAALTAKLKAHCDTSYSLYEEMLNDGVARELARMVLPVNIYTEVYASWDLKNLLHFIELRSAPNAQYEIRVYAEAITKILEELFPWTMQAYHRFKLDMADCGAFNMEEKK